MRVWIASAFVAVFGAVAASACLEPLAEPTTCEEPARVIDDECVTCDPPRQFVDEVCAVCPPEAPVEYRKCVPNAFVDPVPISSGCVAKDGVFERFSCLAGDDPNACDCPGGKSAPDELACFTDTCPSAVLDIAPNAQCFPVTEDDVSWTYDDESVAHREGCSCGCIDRIARCDGIGARLGMYAEETHLTDLLFDLINLNLEGRLPERGRLGVYLRARGFATPLVVAPYPTSTNLQWVFFVTSDYVEQLAFGPDEDAIPGDLTVADPYHFDDDASRPTNFAVGVGLVQAGTGVLHMFEVDCLIPFVVPDE